MEFPTENLEILKNDETFMSEKDVRYFINAIKALGFQAKVKDINSFIEKMKKEENEYEPVCFEEKRKIILEINKDYITFQMEKIVEPLKGFVNPVVCCDSSIAFVLDEEKFKEAAKKGEVPTLPNEVDALNYLEERKSTTCCGAKCLRHPRLF
jgi:hypothetical protein